MAPALTPRRFDSWTNVALFWNWKSAVLSIMLRVPVFAVAASRRGLEAVTAAVVTEAVVCGFNAGCYAAVVQAIRNRKPLWLTALLVAVGLPFLGQVIEYQAHAWRGTPHRIPAVLVSTVLSALSSLFNWYAMQRGALLVGNEGRSFSNDLRQMPSLLGRFLMLGPRWLLRRVGCAALPSS
jgi:fructose-specific phosphotransferase system IIC component